MESGMGSETGFKGFGGGEGMGGLCRGDCRMCEGLEIRGMMS